MSVPNGLEEAYPHTYDGVYWWVTGGGQTFAMGHGVPGTAGFPSLEQTMGGLDHTQARQRVPRTAAGGGFPDRAHTWVKLSP